MKKRIVALLAVALLLLTTGCHQATLENYKLFRSTPLGFSIEYPDFWSKSSSNSDGIAVFMTPTEGYSDGYNETLSVQRFVLDMEGESAYNDYVKGYVADLETTLMNYKLVSETDTTLGGSEAYQIVYESTNEEKESEMRFMQIFTQHGDHVYVVSYIAEFSSYSYFLTYVEKMISTFQFI
ncbi:MAG: hypothetical protein IJ043_06120 [Clostridia bacterium]|nr:hypothetical protein [Clostridia bacterium]